MPMNSEAPRRARIRSGESWSRPSPESTMKRRGWNVVSALIALVAIGRAQLTGTPSATSAAARRSEEHTSELQSRNDISYAVFCLKKKKKKKKIQSKHIHLVKTK